MDNMITLKFDNSDKTIEHMLLAADADGIIAQMRTLFGTMLVDTCAMVHNVTTSISFLSGVRELRVTVYGLVNGMYYTIDAIYPSAA